MWWSSSTFVSSASSTFSSSSERSDSSASTTSHSPSLQWPFGRPPPIGAPISQPGSSPAPRSACTVIAAVVVLPWVPATAIVRRSPESSPSSRARGHSGIPRSRAPARSGFSGATALE